MLPSLNEVRERIVNFWVNNQPKILLLLVLVVSIYLLRQLPYFNFILTFSLIYLFFWLASLFLFKLRSGSSVVLITLTFVVIVFISIFQMTGVDRELADAAYYLSIVTFYQVLSEARDEKRDII